MGLLDTELNVFVNTGADEATLSNLEKSMNSSELKKAFDKSKLVYKEVQVKGKHGTFTRKQWVRPNESNSQSNSGGNKHHKPDNSSEKHTTHFEPLYFPYSNCNAQSTTSVYTESQVKDYYKRKSAGQRKFPSFESFKKENYFMSDGENQTQTIYTTKGGGYIAKRQQLHDEIVDEIVKSADSPPEGKKPVAFLFGGGSASGKSSIISSAVEPVIQKSGLKFGSVDSDAIKKQIPEYEHFIKQNPELAAKRVHNESSDIANEAIDKLIAQNKCFCFDGTMKNFDKYFKLIHKLKQAGYEVNIVSADVPTEEAIRRSELRAKKTNRTVPEGIIRGSHGGFALTFPKLIKEVDNFSLYDNSQPEGQSPTLVIDNSGIHNSELWNRFIKKGQDYIEYKNSKSNKKAKNQH